MAVRFSTRFVALGLRVALGLMFTYSGGEKLLRLDEFTRDVANYRIVLAPWDAVIAYTLPWFELVTGLCLVSGLLVRGALACAVGMTLVFMLGIGQAWYFGLSLHCGCFRSGGEPSSLPLHMLFLVVLLAVIGFLIVAARWSRDHMFGGRRLRLPGR